MFNSLSGTITGKFPKQLFIETSGIEWNVLVPDSCLDEFPAVGSMGKVFTWMNHYENGMDLYGFYSVEERTLFFDLMKVDGIGPKQALKIMSGTSRENLVNVLESGDVSVLEKIQGVGKKTAAKIMLALKGKLTIPSSENSSIGRNDEWAVVIDSLCDMGYERKNALAAVENVVSKFSDDVSFVSLSKQEKEDFLFKKVLIELAN